MRPTTSSWVSIMMMMFWIYVYTCSILFNHYYVSKDKNHPGIIVHSFQLQITTTTTTTKIMPIRKTPSSTLSQFPIPNTKRKPSSLFSKEKDNEDKNSNDDDFIDYILSPPSNDPSFTCTHMIGIPLEQNHDLLLELESIQRAILYHCPLLLHACIAPVVTRMPLLLVDTTSTTTTTEVNTKRGIDFNTMFNRNNINNNNNVNNGGALQPSEPGENDLLTSRDPITRTIHDIVNSVVNDMINVPKSNTNDDDDDDDDEEEESINSNDAIRNKELIKNGHNTDDERDGVNRDNIQPLLLKFQGLEIDGDLNEVLHAIGMEDTKGTITLRSVLDEITKRIEEQTGWKTYIPEDNPQGGGGSSSNGMWRPRIPFMRLPNDFFATLPNPVEVYNGKKWEDCTEEEQKSYMRLPEEGGNGISPLFWFKWMDDPLCNGKSIRYVHTCVAQYLNQK